MYTPVATGLVHLPHIATLYDHENRIFVRRALSKMRVANDKRTSDVDLL